MKVRLIAYTHKPDETCSLAASTSVSMGSPSEIAEKTDPQKAARILGKVVGYGHTSVIEHASFTFSIEGISRACSHQLVRHRIASYTQQSQRYVRLDEAGEYFVIPPSIERKREAKSIFLESVGQGFSAYKELLKEGIAPEDARYVLPNATKTNVIVTMNARSLMNFFGLRLCKRAQWEIRTLASLMLKEVKKVAPVIFENAGPRCVELGYCPESKTCGLYPLKKDVVGKGGKRSSMQKNR
ncbi:MAG: FAD-dependent thymidylate synthase [Candidatus Micrarchaeia archaeon]